MAPNVSAYYFLLFQFTFCEVDGRLLPVGSYPSGGNYPSEVNALQIYSRSKAKKIVGFSLIIEIWVYWKTDMDLDNQFRL